MYHRSIIPILTVLEVEVQPCTPKCWLWFPCRISMDTAGGIWNKWQHIIACRLQTYELIFLSLSHYVVVAVYEWFCIVHASYSLAVTVDLQMTQMQSLTGDSAVVEGGRMWKEMQVISNRIKPACHLLCIKMSISGPVFILETKLRETRRPFFFFFFIKQIYYQCTCPASFIYFNSGIPSWLLCIKARDTTGLSLDEILLQKLLAPYTMAL